MCDTIMIDRGRILRTRALYSGLLDPDPYCLQTHEQHAQPRQPEVGGGEQAGRGRLLQRPGARDIHHQRCAQV